MSARVSLPLLLSLLAFGLGSSGCDDSLKSVSLVEETRVLGARVESDADPSRGSPTPGERASLGVFVVGPDGQPQFSYALTMCAVHLTNTGFPECDSPPFASVVRVEPSPEAARLEFQVPEDVDLEQTPHAFAKGRVCPDSSLIVAADGSSSCANDGGREFAFEFALGGAEDTNHNPSFTED